LASIAASVSTRVVSWKEAADSHDSVASDALVMPMSSGRPGGGLAALGDDPTVLGLEGAPLDEVTGDEVGLAGLDDGDPAQHLPDDDLDVLVVDRHTLLAVDALHLVDQVHLHLARGRGCAAPAWGRWRRRPAGCADLDVVTVGHQQAGPLAHRVGVLLGAVVGHQDDPTGLVGVLDAHPAGGLGDRGDTLGGAGLEELDDTRQTLGDVVTGDPTDVEGAHRQLGAGLTDRLGGDDADRLADVDELAGGQRAAVAQRAGADLAVAGEHRADPDLVDPGGEERVDDHVTEVDAGLRQHRAVVPATSSARVRA
jgi:hypothetical protein